MVLTDHVPQCHTHTDGEPTAPLGSPINALQRPVNEPFNMHDVLERL